MTWDSHTLSQKELLNSELWNHTQDQLFLLLFLFTRTMCDKHTL